jgi:predicted GNAT family N-acyltransferase
MSKFLEGVEEHTPDKDIDAVTKAKRNVQRIFMKAGYTADAKVFRDDITLTLEDGTKVVLEIKSAVKPAVEDAETDSITRAAKTAAAVLAIPDQGLGKQLMNPAARKVQSAKRSLASKLKKAVDAIQF